MYPIKLYYALGRDRQTILFFSVLSFFKTIKKSKSKKLFSRKCITYKFNVLLHLPEFYLIYGPLDKWSTFLFESYLASVKSKIKRTHHLFQHVRNIMTVLSSRKTENRKKLFHFYCPPNIQGSGKMSSIIKCVIF